MNYIFALSQSLVKLPLWRLLQYLEYTHLFQEASLCLQVPLGKHLMILSLSDWDSGIHSPVADGVTSLA